MKNRVIKIMTVLLCMSFLVQGCSAAKSQAKESTDNNETKETMQKQKEEKEKKAEEKKKESEAKKKETDVVQKKLSSVVQQEYTSVKGLKLDKKTYISIVGKGKNSEYWRAVKDGAAQAIKDLNTEAGYTGEDKIYMTYDGPQEDENISQQVNVLDEALSGNPSALCIAPIDIKGFETQLDYTVENGIEVVSLDSGIESGSVKSNTSTDNYTAAREAAAKFCEQIGDEGQVALMVQEQTSLAAQERERGFTEEIQENHPNVQIVNVSYLSDKETTGEEAVKKVLTDYPDLKGYFGTNINSVSTIQKGTEAAEKKDLVLCGFDADNTQLQALKDGKLSGLMVQNPYAMGYTSVVTAAKIILGQEVETNINTGNLWVTKDNADSTDVKNMIN